MTNRPFDEQYFHSEAYADVSFARYSQYWWSNRYYAKLARRYGPDKGTVLEVGCGLGHLLGWMASDYQIVGVDINAWALSQARVNVPQGNFCLLTAEDLRAFASNSFNIVICKHVLEHLAHPASSIAEMSRVLLPGGVLIVATPNLDSPMRKLKKKDWIGYKDPTHISLKTPQEWLQIIKINGLNPFKVFSDGFWDAPYISRFPASLQKLFFGFPGGLQALLGWGIIPVRMGESLIVVAKKPHG
jgi:2-polyprenyl-3-methyl-5-hydroxy-6-metoxy-1,4-benzoquinol methylase